MTACMWEYQSDAELSLLQSPSPLFRPAGLHIESVAKEPDPDTDIAEACLVKTLDSLAGPVS